MARKKPRRRTPGEGSIYWRADIQKYQAMLVIGFTPAATPTPPATIKQDNAGNLTSPAQAWTSQ